MKIAAVQLNSTADLGANLAAADRLTRDAAAAGAKLIVLPEKWTAMGPDDELRAAAEPLDGRAVGWARQLAKELAVDLVAGSFLEQIPGQQKLANTSVHVGPDGTVRAVYRKLHMFDVAIDGRRYHESEIELPGEEVVLSRTAADIELGMAICYDLRFPELFRALAIAGARVFVLPSAFTLATTRDHWEALLRARAIENEVYIVAANQVGAHPGGYRSGGRSMIVDPWGIVLAQAPDGPCQIVAELDLDRQREIRAQLPVLTNRRPELYQLAAAQQSSRGVASARPGEGAVRTTGRAGEPASQGGVHASKGGVHASQAGAGAGRRGERAAVAVGGDQAR